MVLSIYIAEAIKSEKKSAKPPIPKAHVIIPKPTLKHFIKINALENIHSVPKKVPQAGPVFVEKKDYGKVPAYLSKRITQQHEEKIQFSAAQSERAQESIRRAQLERGIIPLPEEERLKVLEGLKLNWEKLNGDYQKLSLTVDTVPKITRKVNMEQQLKQLEEQMAKFSHENIMIDFNDGLQ